MDLSAFNYISMYCSFIYFLKLIYLDRFKNFNCDLCKRNTCEVSRTAGHSYLTYPFLEEIFVICRGYCRPRLPHINIYKIQSFTQI